jgi:hypothetical protein
MNFVGMDTASDASRQFVSNSQPARKPLFRIENRPIIWTRPFQQKGCRTTIKGDKQWFGYDSLERIRDARQRALNEGRTDAIFKEPARLEKQTGLDTITLDVDETQNLDQMEIGSNIAQKPQSGVMKSVLSFLDPGTTQSLGGCCRSLHAITKQ